MRRLLLSTVLVVLLLPSAASAAVSVTRAELSGTTLRVEGRGAVANSTVTATSPESTASARADGSGAFRIESASFRSSTCRVTVSDGPTSATSSLSGCTTSTPTPTPPPPSSSCTLLPQTLGDGNVGTLATWYFSHTGCRTSDRIIRIRLVAGSIPAGTRLFVQGISSPAISGTPTAEGLSTFTLEIEDGFGARDRESYSIRINPPRPLVVTNQSDALTSGVVGEAYCCGNLFADGGVSPYTWSLRSGQLPPGLSLTASPGRITGTPTTRGTFAFVVRVTDTRGAFAERTFSITIS